MATMTRRPRFRTTGRSIRHLALAIPAPTSGTGTIRANRTCPRRLHFAVRRLFAVASCSLGLSKLEHAAFEAAAARTRRVIPEAVLPPRRRSSDPRAFPGRRPGSPPSAAKPGWFPPSTSILPRQRPIESSTSDSSLWLRACGRPQEPGSVAGVSPAAESFEMGRSRTIRQINRAATGTDSLSCSGRQGICGTRPRRPAGARLAGEHGQQRPHPEGDRASDPLRP